MKIGVIGLGLIGGSIFKKLSQNKKYNVIGVSGSVKGKNISKDYSKLKNSDIVFVCTPMSVTLEILRKLEQYVDNDTIVSDVCSLKEFVTKENYKYHFIPTHPMAGTENSGWDSSFPELFKNAKWVITPINGKILDIQEKLESVIEYMGAEIIITTPEEHDKAVAYISHMPMVIAQGLCANIKDNKLAQVLAATGFKDTTRLALSNTQMADDMVRLNRENIELAIDTLYDRLHDLLGKDYKEEIENIKTLRKNMYN